MVVVVVYVSVWAFCLLVWFLFLLFVFFNTFPRIHIILYHELILLIYSTVFKT